MQIEYQWQLNSIKILSFILLIQIHSTVTGGQLTKGRIVEETLCNGLRHSGSHADY